MSDLTTLARVETELMRNLTQAEEAWVSALISKGSRILIRKIPDLESRMASGALDPDLVSDTVATAVVRAFRNPEGLTRTEVAIDDYREMQERASVGVDGLGFTQEELDLLADAESPTGAFTIRPGGSPRSDW